MVRKYRNYYVMIQRDPSDIHLWRWRIERRGEPMGVSLEGRGFLSYNTAVTTGRRALDEFLDRLEREAGPPSRGPPVTSTPFEGR
jgi:hypothetical protein